MKILELTTFSAGICGVGARVLQESQLLANKGHKVHIFSTNFTKGSKDIAIKEESIGKVKITRFPANKLGGESFTYWNFEKEALNFNPDVIIAHAYRHTHTTLALKIGKLIGAKVFLVTHAPFVPKNTTRSFLSKQSVKLYDSIIGPRTLKKFSKVIAITKWELPYLKKLGVNSKKIVYIPNGISEEFFNQKKTKEENMILFVGRISPIKDLETLIMGFHRSKLSNTRLELVGPKERDYHARLVELIAKNNVKNVHFMGPIFDKKQLISKIDQAKIFILPSKREAMPQALIEAMSRSKVVIASDNPGTRDLIINGKNGFLFPVGDSEAVANLLNRTINMRSNKINKEAKKTAEKFKWEKIINILLKILK